MDKNIILGEVSTLHYVARRNPNIDELYEQYIQLYPQTVKFKNVVETGLNCGNPIVHVT